MAHRGSPLLYRDFAPLGGLSRGGGTKSGFFLHLGKVFFVGGFAPILPMRFVTKEQKIMKNLFLWIWDFVDSLAWAITQNGYTEILPDDDIPENPADLGSSSE